MKAIVIGATGAVGKELVRALLDDARYTEVAVFVRRDPGVTHPKLTAHVINFEQPDTWRAFVTGDVLFSALGTSLKQAGSKEAQRRIDYDYQYMFAEAAHANGVPHLVLLSSLGADGRSSIFYLRLKGELDDAVQRPGFDTVHIVRPPILIRPEAKRLGETAVVKILQGLNAVGIAKNLAPMSVDTVARCMMEIGTENHGGVQIITGQDIRDYMR